ncbi:MlaD family protein [Mesorhizobium xinjiangense]|uniref:MlaD family protein n=1 Tax=Mesorhizobium xinjiangense TaxID=2678685 RepID=UPI0012EDE86C|nr:MlaD family protein [Mesorhizobium xinjiangense]
METKANYVIVGIFTVLAVLAMFGFIYWAAGISLNGETTMLRVRIPGSAAGLGRGSFVLFNGVKVGDVRRVYIDVTNPNVAIADAEVDRLTPITPSTAADIGIAGLTGQANIELRGGNPQETNLLEKAEADNTVAEITANPSAVTSLLQSAQDIFTRAEKVMTQLEDFTKEARGPLVETLDNARTFSQALSRNADGVDTFLSNFSELSQKLGTVSDRLDTTLAAAEDLLRSVDRDKIATIVGNVEQFTEKLDSATGDLDTVVANVNETVTSVRRLSDGAGETLGKVDDILASVDPERVKSTMDDIDGAVTDARQAAANVAKLTDRFAMRGDDVDRIITDAQEMSARLNRASVRVDGVLAKVDSLLGSGDAEGVMQQATETLQAFRQVADTLNARLGTITDGLARFSGQGLRDTEALIRDARRSINRIEQAVSDLERNPQRIITGGAGGVPQYDGRTRR